MERKCIAPLTTEQRAFKYRVNRGCKLWNSLVDCLLPIEGVEGEEFHHHISKNNTLRSVRSVRLTHLTLER